MTRGRCGSLALYRDFFHSLHLAGLFRRTRRVAMTYTVERVHSCVAETRQAVFRLTYEVTYIPELNVWRHFLIKKKNSAAYF